MGEVRRSEREDLQKGTRKSLGVMDMFITSLVLFPVCTHTSELIQLYTLNM